jgi:hypothetical protein
VVCYPLPIASGASLACSGGASITSGKSLRCHAELVSASPDRNRYVIISPVVTRARYIINYLHELISVVCEFIRGAGELDSCAYELDRNTCELDSCAHEFIKGAYELDTNTYEFTLKACELDGITYEFTKKAYEFTNFTYEFIASAYEFVLNSYAFLTNFHKSPLNARAKLINFKETGHFMQFIRIILKNVVYLYNRIKFHTLYIQ